jgi:hypothetical protein
MKRIADLLLLITLTGCSTLAPIAGGATGAAIGAAVAGPGGAALGGAGGVAAAQMAYPNEQVDTTVALAAAKQGKPAPGTVASTIHETKGLVWDLGWMYLLIFVFVPLLSKRGRGWVKKFATIHNTVSQKDIEARDEAQDVEISGLKAQINSLQKTKKEVGFQNARLDNLESIIKTTPTGAERLLNEEKKS